VGNRQLDRLSFDVVVIDEAAQVRCARCAVPAVL
jgi:superfamily I DNA and/or RNA helicase